MTWQTHRVPDTSPVRMRVSVRVQTRAHKDLVGGRYGNADPPTLVVRVRAAAHEGLANSACIDALARAFGVPKHAVTIVAGARSRSKIVEVRGGEVARLESLLRD